MTQHPDDQAKGAPSFTEHAVPRQQGSLYVRDYPGTAPAFVLMHGFPDNLHIYDDLIPHLAASGRRIVTFDFLGFGASDKIPGAAYSFEQQLGDLEAVVEALALDRIVPVAHDASGPAALNFALDHPERTASVIMLNSAYAEAADVVWPELITLFATPSLQGLALGIAQSPEQFGWLLGWQRERFKAALPDSLKPHFSEFVAQVIADNFIQQPSSGPAFVQLAAQFFGAHERNARRLPELAALDVPVKLIWGEHDPYLGVALADRRLGQLNRGSLHVLPGGHWLQSDIPEQVAREMLS
jgi:haloalkane dehalogenase